ncbi:MAG TPA: hypothetical protein VEQ60_04950, partial [Longimicrobium sp.]|nr:hypothetical protein [Longimicrobium sp.]
AHRHHGGSRGPATLSNVVRNNGRDRRSHAPVPSGFPHVHPGRVQRPRRLRVRNQARDKPRPDG